MARKTKSGRTRDRTETVENYSASAVKKALGFAVDVARANSPAENFNKVTGMAALCDQAADHMALAHNLLVTHEDHTDTAIEHLDAALGCLRQVIAGGEKRQSGEDGKSGKQTGQRQSA